MGEERGKAQRNGYALAHPTVKPEGATYPLADDHLGAEAESREDAQKSLLGGRFKPPRIAQIAVDAPPIACGEPGLPSDGGRDMHAQEGLHEKARILQTLITNAGSTREPLGLQHAIQRKP